MMTTVAAKSMQLEERSIEVHNSRRPLDRLTLTLTVDLIGYSCVDKV